MTTKRVTITMPTEIVEEIDRQARNRSEFILDAVRREIGRRRQVMQSLKNPHAGSESYGGDVSSRTGIRAFLARWSKTSWTGKAVQIFGGSRDKGPARVPPTVGGLISSLR